ncbi:MAG: hypothetical protein ACJAUQ_001156 [Maribacter sp.]|jgi:hypothetical protein
MSYLRTMGHLLKNKNIEIKIDFPLENYNFSRFDWTGKIVAVKFKGIPLASVEDPNCKNENLFGKGFYNEFGIDTALGFEETNIGEWFHKIGVGLLKKEDANYAFHKPYAIKPAAFSTIAKANSLIINCRSAKVNGYSYELRKEIELQEAGFTINYHLNNTGEKAIHTTEYNHNFTAINNDLIGANYVLNFPFKLKQHLFGETVNPKSAVIIGPNAFNFNSMPTEPFFFSHLSGGERVKSAWELIHLRTKVGIRENSNFTTDKINLWGCKHVVSPEVFFDINMGPGASTEWTRKYELFQVYR